MGFIVGLRCGHKDVVSGSTGASANGLKEVDINTDVFNYTYNRLKNVYGATVYYKHGDLGSTLYDYYNKYLTDNSKLLLSFHHDGNDSESVNGSMVLCSVFASDKSITHANYLLNQFCSAFSSKNRGLLQRKNSEGKDYYGIIRNTKATVLLGEALVLTNTDNSNYIKNNYDEFIKLQGECYIKTVCKWYGITYIAPEEETNNDVCNECIEEIDEVTQDITTLEEELKTLKSQYTALEKRIKTLETLRTNIKGVL